MLPLLFLPMLPILQVIISSLVLTLTHQWLSASTNYRGSSVLTSPLSDYWQVRITAVAPYLHHLSDYWQVRITSVAPYLHRRHELHAVYTLYSYSLPKYVDHPLKYGKSCPRYFVDRCWYYSHMNIYFCSSNLRMKRKGGNTVAGGSTQVQEQGHLFLWLIAADIILIFIYSLSF